MASQWVQGLKNRQDLQQVDADEFDKLSPSGLARTVIEKDGTKFLSDQAIRWKMTLRPAPGHEEKDVEVVPPIDQPGAYLVEALTPDGHRSYVNLWMEDIVVVRKVTAEGIMYLVADARTGSPIEGATVEVSGYHNEYVNDSSERSMTFKGVQIKEFSAKTDAHGIVMHRLNESPEQAGYQWSAIATTRD